MKFRLEEDCLKVSLYMATSGVNVSVIENKLPLMDPASMVHVPAGHRMLTDRITYSGTGVV
jgi:hypothetical protein